MSVLSSLDSDGSSNIDNHFSWIVFLWLSVNLSIFSWTKNPDESTNTQFSEFSSNNL
jgi:hypothetical protein